MSLTRFIKDALRRPEAIPTPGAIFYNATVAKVLRKPETKIANDIVAKMGNGTILDLGSGTGYLSIEIASKAPNLQVYGSVSAGKWSRLQAAMPKALKMLDLCLAMRPNSPSRIIQ